MIESLTQEKRKECQEIVLDFQKYRAKKNAPLEVLRAVNLLLVDDVVAAATSKLTPTKF